jgi:hypothetical protein
MPHRRQRTASKFDEVPQHLPGHARFFESRLFCLFDVSQADMSLRFLHQIPHSKSSRCGHNLSAARSCAQYLAISAGPRTPVKRRVGDSQRAHPHPALPLTDPLDRDGGAIGPAAWWLSHFWLGNPGHGLRCANQPGVPAMNCKSFASKGLSPPPGGLRPVCCVVAFGSTVPLSWAGLAAAPQRHSERRRAHEQASTPRS